MMGMIELNDQRASELISQSFDRPLDDDETAALNEYLANNPHGKKFVRMVRLLQKIAGDMIQGAESGEHVVAEHLPEPARIRIEKMLEETMRVNESQQTVIATPARSKSRNLKRDLVFASVLLDSQRLSADQLSEAAGSWAATNSSLSDFLVARGVIADDARDILESRVDTELSGTVVGFGGDTVDPAGEPGRWSVHRSGVQEQISRLLGLAASEPEILDVRCRLRLLRQIGEGGLGSVWLARDERLNRNVAVKRLRADSEQSAEELTRFRREAEITGHLEHPNIVPLYLAGSDVASGADLNAMRYVGKRTLTDAIREVHDGRSETGDDGAQVHRLLNLFLRVCDAIAYAHSRGIVHRDLKPDNIALDNFGQVIVLDWGLAKIIDEGELGPQMALGEAADDSTLLQTMAGAVLGTPLYMSPEQAAGDIDGIDQRTDIYGLGAILFGILTGRAPHEKSCTIVDGKIDVVKLVTVIAEKESPKPRNLNPKISVDLEAICCKAMAFHRHARHESATQLSDEIEAWLAGTHERHQRYDALRMQGRELANVLTSCFRDLANNARFMGCLPPIQGIIQVVISGDDAKYNIWRERLTTIFHGLLQANSDLAAVTYQRVIEHQAADLVRVERHTTDAAKVRAVPQSRLSREPSELSFEIQKQAPDEAISTMSAREVRGHRNAAFLQTGIPVFDEQSEEPFGNIILEASLEQLLAGPLNLSDGVAAEVIVCDGEWRTLMHYTKHSSVNDRSVGSTVADISDAWEKRVANIDLHSIDVEWIDDCKQFFIRRVSANSFDLGVAFMLVRL